jgi:hypothetical protein
LRRSITITSSRVTHVHQADLEGMGRVVRTLVAHPDLGEHVRLLPMHDDDQRLVGLELAVQDLDSSWRPLDPSVPWKAGSVPVALTGEGALVFSTRQELRHEQLRWLAERVTCALEPDEGQSLLHRVATLEHADGVLGGHALSTGALLLLAEGHGDAPEIGSQDRLRVRFHSAAPDGLPTLQRELSRSAIRGVLPERLADRIVGAARRAARPNGVFTEDAWTACGERTLWSWWLHWKAGAADVPLRELAGRLDIPARDLMVLARAEALPDEVGVSGKLPSREAVVRSLSLSFGTRPNRRARVAFTQRAHRGRLGLFARQTSDLERMFAEDRLTRWATVRGIFRGLRESLGLRSFQHPWEAAEYLSEELLGHLKRADGAHTLASLVHDLGGALAGTVLPFERQQGAWHVEPDGAPVLFLTPAALALSGGARRFAVLHQLGHLVAGHERGCTKWADEDEAGNRDSAPEEQFANAFAAYLAAPRHAVRGLVGRPGQITEEWLKAAARDVALSFGLGPDAALVHVLNCLDQPVAPWQGGPASWGAWRPEVSGLVADRWSEDTRWILAACGGVGRTSVDEALARPHSPVYEELMRRAAEADQVPAALLRAYGL